MRKEKLEELKSIVNDLRTIKKVKRNIENDKKFLKSDSYFCTLNNGSVIPREMLIKGGNDGSAIVVMPITKDNEVLTVIEPRVFTDLTVGVGFPAGYIERGEDVKLSALRELREETGYTTNDIIEIDSFYQDEGCSSALNHLFIAKNVQKTHNQDLDEYELVKYMLFKYDELFELEGLGYIKGGNAKLLLSKSKDYMKGR